MSMPVTAPMTARPLRALRSDIRGAVLIEFTFILPVLLVAVLLGGDYAWYVVTRQRVASVARMTADNASRIGEDDPGSVKQVSEAAILDVLDGGMRQAGGLDMGARGRIILSSLERNTDGGQWIHWQRCAGGLAVDGHPYASTQGRQGDGAIGTGFPGMGATHLQAPENGSVMFVEVAYAYRPLFGGLWNPGADRIVETAAFRTRENRDLSTVHNAEGVAPATCA